MTLIVETGSGLPNADALISIADADAYHVAMGNQAWTGDDETKEQAIRRATAFLTNSYAWAGSRTHGRAQALAWPRSGVCDGEGGEIQPDEIPVEIKNAVAEIALRELAKPGSTNPDFAPSQTVKRRKVGDVEVEFADFDAEAPTRPIFAVIDDMIRKFLKGQSAAALFGRLDRV